MEDPQFGLILSLYKVSVWSGAARCGLVELPMRGLRSALPAEIQRLRYVHPQLDLCWCWCWQPLGKTRVSCFTNANPPSRQRLQSSCYPNLQRKQLAGNSWQLWPLNKEHSSLIECLMFKQTRQDEPRSNPSSLRFPKLV